MLSLIFLGKLLRVKGVGNVGVGIVFLPASVDAPVDDPADVPEGGVPEAEFMSSLKLRPDPSSFREGPQEVETSPNEGAEPFETSPGVMSAVMSPILHGAFFLCHTSFRSLLHADLERN